MALKEAEVKQALKRLLKEVEVLRAQARARGLQFVGLNAEQLTRKLRGETSNSPFFTAYAWDQFTDSGSPSFVLANYFNPDPQVHLCFASLLFGLAHLAPDIATVLAARDTRWPCVSTELVALDTGQTGVAEFVYPVPYAPVGTYFANMLLWGWSVGEVSPLFDRAGPMYVTLK